MAYAVARTRDCDGTAVSDTTSAINKVSDEYLLSHYEFRCLTDNVNGRNAWMMTVPISTSASSYAHAGEYEVTIKSGKIADDGGNFASEYSFTEKIGCDTSSAANAELGKMTAAKSANNTVTRLSLGAERAHSHELGSVISRGDKSALSVALGAYALAISMLCAFLVMKLSKTKDAMNKPTGTVETYDEMEVLEPLQSHAPCRHNYGTNNDEVL